MTTDEVRRYWNERIHDLEMTTHPVGSREFFADLDEYRFDKLRYLPELRFHIDDSLDRYDRISELLDAPRHPGGKPDGDG